jgi:hypothetical protein
MCLHYFNGARVFADLAALACGRALALGARGELVSNSPPPYAFGAGRTLTEG